MIRKESKNLAWNQKAWRVWTTWGLASRRVYIEQYPSDVRHPRVKAASSTDYSSSYWGTKCLRQSKNSYCKGGQDVAKKNWCMCTSFIWIRRGTARQPWFWVLRGCVLRKTVYLVSPGGSYLLCNPWLSLPIFVPSLKYLHLSGPSWMNCTGINFLDA